MQRRSFLLLAGATAVLVAGAGITLSGGDHPASRAAPGERALPKLAAKLGDIAWIRLSRGTTKVNFADIGGNWAVVEKGNYPAAAGKVRQLLLALSDLTLVEPKTQQPELFPRLELDDPINGKATQVVIQDRTGQIIGELIIGKRRANRLGTGNDGVYVRRVGETRAWLARGSADVTGDVASWLDRRILDIPDQRIGSIVLTGAEGGVLVISRRAPGDKFAVDNAPSDAKFKGDAVLAGPAAALAALDLIDVKPAADQPVPDSGVATAAYTTFDGLTVRLKLFERDKVDWVAIETSAAGAAAAEGKALNDRVQRWCYSIPDYKAKLLRTKLADVVEPPKGS